MEHSKIIGSKEEYGSSVSGWTMYIGSPVHENYNYGDDDDDQNTDEQADNCNKYYNGYDDAGDASGKSDDSMASDASSGPSHRGLPWEGSAQSLDRHGARKCSSKEQLHKQKIKRNERRSKVERDKPVLKAKVAAHQDLSGGKVRKTIYTDQEK